MFFEDFKLGTSFELPPVRVDRERIRSFAKDYDPLPLHLDEEKAKASRFKGLIAPGVMSFMLVWAEFVKLGVVNDNLIAGLSTKIEWFAPVYIGDELTGKVTVTGLEGRTESSGLVELTTEVFNQSSMLVLRDVTELLMDRQL